MSMFECLKFPDMIDIIVSSQKLDWTHTFGTTVMRLLRNQG